MPTDPKYPSGMIIKHPRENAPDYIKARISIKVDDFIGWLTAQADGEWINLDVKESQKGGLYAQLDTWKPQSQRQPETSADDGGDDSPF